MPEYEVRQLDRQAEIIASQEVTRETDSDAVGIAYETASMAAKNCRAVEVWNGARMVARVPVRLVARI